MARRVTAIVVSVVAIAGSCRGNETPARQESRNQTSIVRLEIDVNEGGATRRATIDCGSEPHSSGFISNDVFLNAACKTALANDYADEFLRDGRFPPDLRRDGCAAVDAADDYAGASARFVGTFEDRAVDQRLEVATSCDQALWRYLLPLTEPRREGVVVAGNGERLSEE